MGAVTLLVGDLDAMTRYYRDVVTLEVLAAEGDTVTLGRAGRPIVVLRHEPALRHATPGSAGLFHTAILFETQAALAAALYSVARHAPGTFTGSADHLVSQAFYFTDPEGNGIELYWDRARTDVVVDARPGRDGDALPRPERVPRRAPHRGGRARRDGAGCGIRRSCASLGGGCRDRARVLRRRPRVRRDRGDWAIRPCSSAPAATTTTWR